MPANDRPTKKACQPQDATSHAHVHMKKIADVRWSVAMKQQQAHALCERTVYALVVRMTLVKELNRSSWSLCQRGCDKKDTFQQTGALPTHSMGVARQLQKQARCLLLDFHAQQNVCL